MTWNYKKLLFHVMKSHFYVKVTSCYFCEIPNFTRQCLYLRISWDVGASPCHVPGSFFLFLPLPFLWFPHKPSSLLHPGPGAASHFHSASRVPLCVVASSDERLILPLSEREGEARKRDRHSFSLLIPPLCLPTLIKAALFFFFHLFSFLFGIPLFIYFSFWLALSCSLSSALADESNNRLLWLSGGRILFLWSLFLWFFTRFLTSPLCVTCLGLC